MVRNKLIFCIVFLFVVLMFFGYVESAPQDVAIIPNTVIGVAAPIPTVVNTTIELSKDVVVVTTVAPVTGATVSETKNSLIKIKNLWALLGALVIIVLMVIYIVYRKKQIK